ncbi:F0F1 ATP synthase subunit delta [Alteribacter lacisalsi]|jgi:F-type H+-transporting ATPase subunit delta|uniref:ATP synthase subunit delta n=1 Tax=Alteribacter lacisalsi TaxID=2045244 RepID=A0A2W0H2Q1_9BACI|nr:F0F1 ATP synthase subunit delta [Alteribacter lacisalsi]PYZ96083.1 F0F1 ATP synthase subunit delta [Alteribacter lacisalsi]
MKRDPLAFRYASALYDLAKERGQLDAYGEELQLIKEVFEDTNLLDEVFRHPSIANDTKKSLLKVNFGDKVSAEILNLLLLLVDRKRISIVPALADEYKRLSYQSKGVAEATVYAAKKLTDEELQLVADKFARHTKHEKILVDEVTDPTMIGGIKVRVGDLVFDGSIANQLQRIHRRMLTGNVSR